jgi:hypothetical protein
MMLALELLEKSQRYRRSPVYPDLASSARQQSGSGAAERAKCWPAAMARRPLQWGRDH